MSNKSQVVILAGGAGSRLRPFTTVLPKPLLPIGDLPILEVIVRQLRSAGFCDIAISTGHLAGLIEAYFGNGKKWGVSIRYLREDRPLGTAGALKLVKSVQDNFLVLNGDILTDIDYKALMSFHLKQKAAATVTCKARKVKIDFGVVKINKDHTLADYIEKPEHTSFVSAGLNVLSKRAVKYIKTGESIGMPDLVLRMKEAEEKIVCYKTKGIWLDLGRRDDLESAQEVFLKNERQFLK